MAEVVERQEGLREQGRVAAHGVGDRGAEADARGLDGGRADHRHRVQEGVRAADRRRPSA